MDYFYFRLGSDVCCVWYKVCCMGVIFIYRLRLIFIKCDKIILFCYKNGVYSMFDVDYIIIEVLLFRFLVGSLYFYYVVNYFVVCILLCGEFFGLDLFYCL